MGLKDLAKVQKHMSDFTLTMNKIFTELHEIRTKINEQSKVMNAMLDALCEMEKQIDKLKK